VLEQWQEARKARGNAVPQILQKPYDCTAFSHWLALFVTEVRKADGGKYPPNSVYQILCEILRFTRKQDPLVPNFLDQKDGRFHELHGTCESVFRELRQTALEQIPKKLRIYPNSKKIIFGRQEYHLQKYKRTGEKQQAISNILSSPVERSYSSHLVSVGHASDPHPFPLPQMHPPVLYPSASVSSQSVTVFCSVSNLLSLFQASAGVTLNINPHGNFVLNVQFGNRSQFLTNLYKMQILMVIEELNMQYQYYTFAVSLMFGFI